MAVYYLSFFTNDKLKDEDRVRNKASAIPVLYVTDAIKRSGNSVTCISASKTLGRKSCQKHIIEVDAMEKDVFFKSLGKRGKITSFLGVLQTKYELIKFFLEKVKKHDTVIVYHSLFYIRLVSFLHKIIKFKLILEVAEIYSDVRGTNRLRKTELRLCSKADAYLFFSNPLEKLINNGQKPYAISHGTYFEEPVCSERLFEKNGVKHLVYAGTFNEKKGGAAIAARVAGYLPKNYHVHIIGSGTNEEYARLQKTVSEISSKDCAAVSIDGCFSGYEYKKFLQSCDVGLSTQNSDGKFNDTSFPSKVTSYLSNGLRVVAGRIAALEQSAVNSLLYYYDGNDPKAIAQAVLNIDWEEHYDSREAIKGLDAEFVEKIGELLENGQ